METCCVPVRNRTRLLSTLCHGKALRTTIDPAAATKQRGMDQRKRTLERMRAMGVFPYTHTHIKIYIDVYCVLDCPANIARTVFRDHFS